MTEPPTPQQLVGARNYEEEFKVRSALINGLTALQFWAVFTQTKEDDNAIARAKSAMNNAQKWEAIRSIIWED